MLRRILNWIRHLEAEGEISRFGVASQPQRESFWYRFVSNYIFDLTPPVAEQLTESAMEEKYDFAKVREGTYFYVGMTQDEMEWDQAVKDGTLRWNPVTQEYITVEKSGGEETVTANDYREWLTI